MKFSNFGQNHFSDFETPFSVGLMAEWSRAPPLAPREGGGAGSEPDWG